MRKPGSNSAETRRRLGTAALRLLFQHGYAAMDMRTLARSVDLQVGSLYNYFDSKQHLLLWLLKDNTEKILAELDKTLEGIEDPEAQMRAFVAFHLSYYIANRKGAWVLTSEMRSLTRENYRAIANLHRRYTDKVHGIVKRGITAGQFRARDSQVVTFALLQMLSAVIRWYRPKGRLTLDELIAMYTDLTFGMLGAGDHAKSSHRETAGCVPLVHKRNTNRITISEIS